MNIAATASGTNRAGRGFRPFPAKFMERGGIGARSGDCNSWTISNDSPVDGTAINGVTADSPPTWTANITSFTFHDE